MMLAAPISWQENVEQYAGRLHRDYEGKKDVIIYDYVDTHIKVLERMYHKRLRTYKKIGYEICLNLSHERQQANAIFDMESYQTVYEKDPQQANKEIVISSPGINKTMVKRTLELVEIRQTTGVMIKWNSRLSSIVHDSDGIGWGFHDYLVGEYCGITWVEDED